MSRVHEIPLALRACYLGMHRATSQRLAEFGITADQFVALLHLAEAGPVIQRELVVRMSSDANTVRAMLVLLERKRLVRRTPDAADARARRVELTAKGRVAINQAQDALTVLHRRLRTRLSVHERANVPDLLHRMTKAFAAEEGRS